MLVWQCAVWMSSELGVRRVWGGWLKRGRAFAQEFCEGLLGQTSLPPSQGQGQLLWRTWGRGSTVSAQVQLLYPVLSCELSRELSRLWPQQGWGWSGKSQGFVC